MLSALRRLRSLKVSVRARLGLIQVLLVAALAATSFVAWHAIDSERQAGQSLAALSRAQRFHLNADMMHDALRADVNAALRVDKQNSAAAGEVVASIRENSRRFETDVASLADLDLPADLRTMFVASKAMSESYIALANDLVGTAVRDRDEALAMEPTFNGAFEELLEMNDKATDLLGNHVENAERAALDAAAAAKVWIIGTSAATGLLAWTFVALLASSIRRSLRQVSDAARALAAGNFSVRSEIASHDEVGELAGAVNKMADDLQNMIDRLLADADRDAFSSQLMQALEMAETERDVQGVVTRAMVQVGETLPMELLLSDGTRPNLVRTAEHPIAGPAGCSVESVSNCAAIRRGTPIVFDDSDALNACPKLRGRACGSMSAVCVPISFMGRSFGVLHVGGQPRKPPSLPQVAQLTALGAQAGARVGTVRAFERTQLHAYTDGLTGLSNRRALEQVLQDLSQTGQRYAFALADLDNFKSVNDVHGHEAGDKALRQFAEILRKSIRSGDHAGRWGGEEFALLFVGATAPQALEVIERIREDLATALRNAGGVAFTSSFGIGDSSMAQSFDEVLRLTDDALYRSKDEGRNRATIGGGSPDPELQAIVDLAKTAQAS